MKDILFYEYFKNWVELYKEGIVSNVTLNKYKFAYVHLKRIAPDLKLKDLTRNEYQRIMLAYGKTHEINTCKDFHHIVKASVEDAVQEGYLLKNPVYKIVLKGKAPRPKKKKFLNEGELKILLSNLKLGEKITKDWGILLLAKTGLRFAEFLGLTKNDFDFEHQILNVNKTWDYKTNKGFAPTKNKSSVRKIKLDWQTAFQFQGLLKNIEEDDKPIFVDPNKKIYNTTYNDFLKRKCEKSEIPVISIHGLRHTHASILLKEGISVASVARRLGHSNMATTQRVYLHIVTELEQKDNLNIMKAMAAL